YLFPTIKTILDSFFTPTNDTKRVFDLGCGNGSVAHWLSQQGYAVTGVDPSSEGIAVANREYPNLDLQQSAADDSLADRFGSFPAVISLEVIEHVYAPREFIKSMYRLVDGNGLAILSTPYHGYVKNIAVALSGNFDHHFNPLWDHGHIKFW